jgi:hypothetical protein
MEVIPDEVKCNCGLPLNMCSCTNGTLLSIRKDYTITAVFNPNTVRVYKHSPDVLELKEYARSRDNSWNAGYTRLRQVR